MVFPPASWVLGEGAETGVYAGRDKMGDRDLDAEDG